jgi:hypothetical protein
MITGVSKHLPEVAASKTNIVQDVFRATVTEKVTESATLSKEQQSQVDSLKKIDQEVHAHEQAHKNVGGQYAGNVHFRIK